MLLGLRARALTLPACPPRIGGPPVPSGVAVGSNSGCGLVPGVVTQLSFKPPGEALRIPPAQPLVRGQSGCKGGGSPMRKLGIWAGGHPTELLHFFSGCHHVLESYCQENEASVGSEAPLPHGSTCVAAAGVSPPAWRPAALSRPGTGPWSLDVWPVGHVVALSMVWGPATSAVRLAPSRSPPGLFCGAGTLKVPGPPSVGRWSPKPPPPNGPIVQRWPVAGPSSCPSSWP